MSKQLLWFLSSSQEETTISPPKSKTNLRATKSFYVEAKNHRGTNLNSESEILPLQPQIYWLNSDAVLHNIRQIHFEPAHLN